MRTVACVAQERDKMFDKNTLDDFHQAYHAGLLRKFNNSYLLTDAVRTGNHVPDEGRRDGQ